jgi:hypothetical protein
MRRAVPRTGFNNMSEGVGHTWTFYWYQYVVPPPSLYIIITPRTVPTKEMKTVSNLIYDVAV